MDNEAIEELKVFFKKHGIDYAIVLLPDEEGGLKAALHGVDEEQMWLICDAVCKTEKANAKERKFNG